MATKIEKREWVKPELEKLDIEKTLSGKYYYPRELYDGKQNPAPFGPS